MEEVTALPNWSYFLDLDRNMKNPIAGLASDSQTLPDGRFYFLLKPNGLPYKEFYIDMKKRGAKGLKRNVEQAVDNPDVWLVVFYTEPKPRYVTDVRVVNAPS